MLSFEPSFTINTSISSKTQGRGNATKIYNPLKQKIDGHVESVYVERMNKEFGIGLYMPISITTVDNTKTFDTIDFDLCGKKLKAKSIFDCNNIGDNERKDFQGSTQ